MRRKGDGEGGVCWDRRCKGRERVACVEIEDVRGGRGWSVLGQKM